jgi:hypothetical protein
MVQTSAEKPITAAVKISLRVCDQIGSTLSLVVVFAPPLLCSSS